MLTSASPVLVTGPGARKPGAVSGVQVLSQQWYLPHLQLELPELKRACKDAGLRFKPTDPKPVLQSILLQHLSAQSLPRAPSSSAAPATATAQVDLNGLKLGVLQDVKEFFEPRLQQVSQQAADLAAHNAVQGQVLEQTRVQLANTQAQLQATQAEVQGLSRAAAAAADAAATAGDREEIDRRATNLTVSNLPGVSSETEAVKVCSEMLQHLEVQTQPEIKLLRPSYADAARAGAAGSSAGPARSSKVLLVFGDVQAKTGVLKSLGKLKGSSFEKIHVDLDLTPAQAAVRRAKQPEFVQLQRQGRQPRWRGTDIICRQMPKRPASAVALSAAAPAFTATAPIVAVAPAAASAATASALPSQASAVQAPVTTPNPYATLA